MSIAYCLSFHYLSVTLLRLYKDLIYTCTYKVHTFSDDSKAGCLLKMVLDFAGCIFHIIVLTMRRLNVFFSIWPEL